MTRDDYENWEQACVARYGEKYRPIGQLCDEAERRGLVIGFFAGASASFAAIVAATAVAWMAVKLWEVLA